LVPEKPSTLLILPACDEDDIIGGLIRRVPGSVVDGVCLVDDGSSDRTPDEAEAAGAVVLRHGKRRGVGAAIRTGIEYAIQNGYQAVVVMAANGKDRPEEIPAVAGPVLTGQADYVQGSRWISGGVRGNMPVYRRIATRAYPLFLSALFRRRLTECTNGFRCYTTALCQDRRINLQQAWLDKYELELYLHYKALTLGYRYREVPVSKVYPQRDGRPYTKIKAFSGWWSMMRPVLLLALHIRR
jgi:dolichol-phosphate mannosyltransferase